MWSNPNFWYREPVFFESFFLKPISALYSCVAKKNYNRKYQNSLSNQKVIAVGGLTVGGSGKTIVTQFIVNELTKQGKRVAVLSRGYGRKSDKIIRVNPEEHSHKDVGDEPLLLSKYCPVFVGKNRAESAKFAGDDFDVFVLDDGIVQRYLKPDLRVLVVDGKQGIGNGHMLPLGPNRLKLSWIKDDINAIVSFNNFKSDFEPVFNAQTHITPISGAVIAFCGLGYPQKFFDSLTSCSLLKCIEFPDHHKYTDDDIKNLLNLKHQYSAKLVTTMKDFVKIPKCYQSDITAIDVNASIDGFSDWLNTVV